MKVCSRCGGPLESVHICGDVLAATMPLPRSWVSPDTMTTEPAAPLPPDQLRTKVAADPTLPDFVEGYRLTFVIGTGGMATVFQGEKDGRRVAVKVPRRSRSDDISLKRALNETRAAGRITHPNVLPLLGSGELPDGRPYLITELLDGEPLDAVLAAQGSVPWPAAVALLDDIAAALEAAHSVGVVHRDLKPGNVFLAKRGTYVRAMVIDFGLALMGLPGYDTPQTDIDRIPGTAAYSSPEQARGEALGASSDLYALGVVGYELLLGKQPFTAPDPMKLLELHARAKAPSLSGRLDLPGDLTALIDALLSKASRARPQSATQVREVLRSLEPTSVVLPGILGEHLASWRSRRAKKTA